MATLFRCLSPKFCEFNPIFIVIMWCNWLIIIIYQSVYSFVCNKNAKGQSTLALSCLGAQKLREREKRTGENVYFYKQAIASSFNDIKIRNVMYFQSLNDCVYNVHRSLDRLKGILWRNHLQPCSKNKWLKNSDDSTHWLSQTNGMQIAPL